MEDVMRQLRPAFALISLALLGVLAGGAWARTPPPAEPTVSCDRIVLRDRTAAGDGFRVLLGAVSVPGSRQLAHSSTATPGRRWRYFRRAGIAIRAGATAVTVSVPEGWRDRVALSWGGSPASGALRFGPCGPPTGTWNVYSGGFHLRKSGDCVPLLVTVGGMSTTVRVGLGRACGARG
jgi:hypothetical protein